MILDIRYFDRSPEQIQKVKLVTMYTQRYGSAPPELIIHFYPETEKPQREIPIASIKEVQFTND